MIKILQSGLTLVQDGIGRSGYASSGVPKSGAFDAVSLAQANYLVGNPLSHPGFEIHGGKFEFLSEQDVIVGIIGGNPEIMCDGKIVYSQTSIIMPAFSFLSIRPDIQHNGLTYLAISGFSPKQELGSASYDTFSKLGTPPVLTGDTFQIESTGTNLSELRQRIILETKQNNQFYSIPVIGSVHYEDLGSPNSLNVSVKTIARSGVRLSAKPSSFKNLESFSNLGSLPVFPGVVQITPAEEIIILGPDSGVTGGYPILGYVPDSHMHLLSRLSAGASLRLSIIEKQNTSKKDNLKLGLL
jgi:allophanate hydrolase subunit 2